MSEYDQLSFMQLYEMRVAGDRRDSTIAAEHRAFAREVVAERPLMAIPLAVATPAYQALKATIGPNTVSSKLQPSSPSTVPPSDASLLQLFEAFKGIYEGLKIYRATQSQ